MTNDLGCQAVLSDILFCLTYESSGIIARVRLQALDVCEAKTSPHLGVWQPGVLARTHTRRRIQRPLLVCVGALTKYFPSHLLQHRLHALSC